ncbi:hypothetical protein HanRHA438_Chr02g0085741 [Helianthus annuus]|nr:hypothetical protein HanRHA438_Chr02g0085741 [Helianthus annuus]
MSLNLYIKVVIFLISHPCNTRELRLVNNYILFGFGRRRRMEFFLVFLIFFVKP